MSHQQDLFPADASKPDAPVAPQSREDLGNAPSPLWLQRSSIIVLVIFCLYIGLILFLLPWSRYWIENHYLLTWPSLGLWMSSGFVRGFVSGMGLLDIWIGISEIIHYREYPA